MLSRALLRSSALAGESSAVAPKRLLAQAAAAATSVPMDEQEDPSFFKMTEYFVDRGCNVIESKLVSELRNKDLKTEEQKRHYVRGVLSNMKPCNKVRAS